MYGALGLIPMERAELKRKNKKMIKKTWGFKPKQRVLLEWLTHRVWIVQQQLAADWRG